MAAAGAERTTDANMQGLTDKKAVVRRVVAEALGDLLIQGQTRHVEITLSRHYKIFMGVCDSNLLEATADDWQNILCEGLGTKFHVDWYRTKYSRGDLRVLRLGEPIFDVLRLQNLNPDWDGTRAGDFTITAVDETGAKLALAMALHPRLGSESPLSLMEPGLVRLIADLSVHFSGGQDGGGRARWGWPSPGGTPPFSDGDTFDTEYDNFEGYYDDNSDFDDPSGFRPDYFSQIPD